jgi:hypothetical protein
MQQELDAMPHCDSQVRPNDATDKAEYDLGSISGQIAARQARALPQRYQQSPEDYEREIAAYKAQQFADLASGKVQARSVRRIESINVKEGTYTRRVRKSGGPWSVPQKVSMTDGKVVCRPQYDRAPSARPMRIRGRCESRPGYGRASAPTRAGPDDGPSDLDEPPPRRGGLRHISVVLRDAGFMADAAHPDLTTSRPGDDLFSDEEVSQVARIGARDSRGEFRPAKFYSITRPLMFGLGAEGLATARLRVFLELPPTLQTSFYDSIRVGAGTRALRAVATADIYEPDRQLTLGLEGAAS